MQIFGLTNQGKIRENNEDSFAIYSGGINKLPNLAIVADGMGGHQSGEVASQSVIQYFISCIEKNQSGIVDILDFLAESLRFANEAVYEKSITHQEYFGMGTTFTACVVTEGKGYVVHVGDSRLYVFKDGELCQITTDHTYIHEMIKAGEITEEEALTHPKRNAITRAIGVNRVVEVDGYVFEFDADCMILICSDGLTNMISHEEMYNILAGCEGIERGAEELIQRANDNGGIDNITVVLARAKR